jgi:ribosomal protein S21
MSISTLFTIAMALIFARIFWLKIKDVSMKGESFKKLPPKDQLAVLKECLLNNPTETNLKNLKEFSEKQGIVLDIESYRPFIKKQQELTRRKDALAEDNELFTAEAEWVDKILPLEFEEAKVAKQENRHEDFILHSLEGVARLYSDGAILSELEALVQDYPKAKELAQGYRELMELRDSSGADDESLKKLRAAKESWEKSLLDVET